MFLGVALPTASCHPINGKIKGTIHCKRSLGVMGKSDYLGSASTSVCGTIVTEPNRKERAWVLAKGVCKEKQRSMFENNLQKA